MTLAAAEGGVHPGAAQPLGRVARQHDHHGHQRSPAAWCAVTAQPCRTDRSTWSFGTTTGAPAQSRRSPSPSAETTVPVTVLPGTGAYATRSPGSKPPKRPGPGLRRSLSAALSARVPAEPPWPGVMTWVSAYGTPMALGTESATS